MKKRKVKVTYDQESDILALFTGGGRLDHTEELWPFIVHFDKKNKPIYIEILGVSRVLPSALKKSIHLKQAA